MIKWEHSVFALPFAYLGLFLGEGGWPRAHLFWGVTVAMISFRTMAMGANRLLDRKIDAANPRTQIRALPQGRLKAAFVLMATLLALLVFELSTVYLGRLCFWLSPIPVVLAWIYPYLKRFTWLSHFVLGIILGIAPYGGWLASRGELSWIPALLGIGVMTWVTGFDIIYALQDVEFDRDYGLHSVPVRFGQNLGLTMAQVLHGVSIVSWFLAGWLFGLRSFYFAGMIIVSVFLIRENWLIRSFGLKRLEEAFFTMNAIVSFTVWLAAVADLCLR